MHLESAVFFNCPNMHVMLKVKKDLLALFCKNGPGGGEGGDDAINMGIRRYTYNSITMKDILNESLNPRPNYYIVVHFHLSHAHIPETFPTSFILEVSHFYYKEHYQLVWYVITMWYVYQLVRSVETMWYVYKHAKDPND